MGKIRESSEQRSHSTPAIPTNDNRKEGETGNWERTVPTTTTEQWTDTENKEKKTKHKQELKRVSSKTSATTIANQPSPSAERIFFNE